MQKLRNGRKSTQGAKEGRMCMRGVEEGRAAMKMLAQGNTAEIYDYGMGRILKLFREGIPAELAELEYWKAKTVSNALDNVPRVYDLIECDGRRGIVYEKIEGGSMIAAMAKAPWNLKKYSRELARIQVGLHGRKVGFKRGHDADFCYSVKEKLAEDIDAAEGLANDEKARIKKYLRSLPDGNSLLHFDFHPGNVLLRGGEPVVIDWMTACAGDPCADVARTWLLLEYGELGHVNWLARKMARVFEKRIGKYYLAEYRRASGISEADVERWILPVAAARLREWITENERETLLKLVRRKLGEI